MDSISLREVNLNDIAQLQGISIQTFSETFAASNTEEDMANYLKESLSIEKLSEELNNPNAQFFFAVSDDQVIGYLKLNYGESQTELKDNKGMEIERIYVLQAFLGKNVGQMLYDKAIQIAGQKQLDYVWLGVWEENHRAIKFYKKNGFVEFDKHIFMLGNDVQTDIMMKLIL